MHHSVTVSLQTRADGEWLELDGGHPGGRDSLHDLVASWPGWQRCPQLGTHNGYCSSRYHARPWPSAILPLTRSSLAISYTPEARAFVLLQMSKLQELERIGTRLWLPESLGAYQQVEGGRKPMVHQVPAIERMRLQMPALLKDDMGLGKTATALFVWGSEIAAQRLLVICPKSVKLNWQKEIEAIYSDTVRVYVLDGTVNQRTKQIGYMQACMTQASRGIAIVNYDLLCRMSPQHQQTLEQWVKGQMIVMDEFHYCKESKTKRTKAVRDLSSLTTLRLGLTGTPVRNTVEDLFSQFQILRPGTWASYHDFCDRHLVMVPAQFGNMKRPVNVVRGAKNLEALNEVVNTICWGRKKEDVLTLPPRITTKPELELDGMHLDVYKALKKHAVIELEKLSGVMPEEDVTVFNPAARSAVEAAMRCEMLAQGFLSGLPEEYAKEIAPKISKQAEKIDGYPNAFAFPDSAKMAWLLETMEDLRSDGRSVVVFSRFNAPLLWLLSKTKDQDGLNTGSLLIGSMSAIERQQAIEAFQAGTTKVMLCQVKLAEGFNLTTAQDVLFLGRDWSPAINAQAEARCHRIGTKGTVNIQIPILVNTVERLLDRRLAAKGADAEQTLKPLSLRDLIEAL